MILIAPWMLGLLLSIPLLALLARRSQGLQARAAEQLRGPRPAVRFSQSADAYRLAALACLILALARPAWNPHLDPREIEGRDLVIALDVSRSMLAQDVFPNRLDAARTVVFESLPQLQSHRMALITFSGSAHVRVPLTLDHAFMKYRLDLASPADADIGSTALQAPIEKAIDTVLPESEKGRQDLILFTDGEDHLSDLDTCADRLREAGLRVLIIGLGDPVDGARIPSPDPENPWMQYEEQDVITRLNDDTLVQLAEASPLVTYFAAGTRPFDLMTPYQKMIKDVPISAMDHDQYVVYSEAYPCLLALALLLWFLPLRRKAFIGLLPAFMLGCNQAPQTDLALYGQRMQQGKTQWEEAQSSLMQEPQAHLPLLINAREQFLLAALLQPGDLPAAAQVAGLSAQIRLLEAELEKQQQSEDDLQQRIQEITQALRECLQNQTQQTQQSNSLLRRKPPASPEEARGAAPPALSAQTDLNQRTIQVLDTARTIQKTIQDLLRNAFPDQHMPPTEFDPVVRHVETGSQHQELATNHLKANALRWNETYSQQHYATQQLAAALRCLEQQNQSDSEEGDEGDYDDMEYDEDMEWSDMQGDASESMNASSQEFRSQLDSPWQAPPNYSPMEILAEEQANQSKRAEQQAARAGAGVEKNW